MVFKRRNKRSLWRALVEAVYPRGGWKRAFEYVKHRVHRLPDPPHRIARGIFAGVFTCFTPLFGLHFLVAAGIALILRGNVIAALLATFFGNPLTYLPIAFASLQTGHFLLGNTFDEEVPKSLLRQFRDAGHDLLDNFFALFSGEPTHWSNLSQFWAEVFLPYLVGGIIPGLITALAFYYASVPVLTVYQNRRKGVIKAKLAQLRDRGVKKPAPSKSGDEEH